MRRNTGALRRALVCVAASAACTLGGSVAQAGVATYVSNYSPLSGNRNFTGYNFTTDSQFNIFIGNSGASTYTACNQACGTSNNGTPGSSPAATSAFSQGTLSDVDQGGPSSGGGLARADLATGQLGAASDGTYRSAFGGGTGITTRSFATFNDTLQFAVSGASGASLTNIGVDLVLHGQMLQTNVNTGGSARSYLNFGGATFDGTYGIDFYHPQPAIIRANASGWQSYAISQLPDGISFSGVYQLQGAASSVNVGEFLDVSCGNGTNCDFSHTAQFSFALPTSVTFTSASGVFLTQTGGGGGGGAVPEPASWALMISGFGLAGATLRRRRALAA